MLKLGSRGFDRTQYCLAWYPWWNMLINFSKQIGLAKIINKKGIQDLGEHLRWRFFRKSFLGLKENSESCQTSKMELFCKNSQKRKAVHYFCKNLHLGCLTRFWICFWIGFQSYGCFIFKSIWISKVTDNLLGKTKKKEPAELLK